MWMPFCPVDWMSPGPSIPNESRVLDSVVSVLWHHTRVSHPSATLHHSDLPPPHRTRLLLHRRHRLHPDENHPLHRHRHLPRIRLRRKLRCHRPLLWPTCWCCCAAYISEYSIRSLSVSAIGIAAAICTPTENGGCGCYRYLGATTRSSVFQLNLFIW